MNFEYYTETIVTFALSFVSRGHDFPASAFRKQHNTDLSVRLCLESCVEGREVKNTALKGLHAYMASHSAPNLVHRHFCQICLEA